MRNQKIRSSQDSRSANVAGYLAKVYSYMTLGVGLTAASAFFCASVPALRDFVLSSGMQLLFAFAPLGIVIYLSRSFMGLEAAQAQMWFWIYSIVMGVSLTSIFSIFSLASISQAFLASASGFGALSLYGYTTKRDLSAWGSFLMMGVVGLIVASLINLFIQGAALNFAISLVGVFVFAGLTAYDVQMIKRLYFQLGGNEEMQEKMAVFGALRLYMDFINLFLSLLNFFGDRR
jgi:uncharacterized protein